MNILEPWLSRYAWYKKLPDNWKRITHMIVSEIGAETFVGLHDLHDTLANMDSDTVLEILGNRTDVRKDVVNLVEKLA